MNSKKQNTFKAATLVFSQLCESTGLHVPFFLKIKLWPSCLQSTQIALIIPLVDTNPLKLRNHVRNFLIKFTVWEGDGERWKRMKFYDIPSFTTFLPLFIDGLSGDKETQLFKKVMSVKSTLRASHFHTAFFI